MVATRRSKGKAKAAQLETVDQTSKPTENESNGIEGSDKVANAQGEDNELGGTIENPNLIKDGNKGRQSGRSGTVRFSQATEQASDSDESEPKAKSSLHPKHAKTTRKETTGHSRQIENGLTKLIPGYVAPLQLDTSTLDRYRPGGGMAELRRKAERTDASTAKFVVEATKPHVQAMKRTTNGFLPSSYAPLYSSFKTGTKRAPDISAGKGWFGMMPTAMTDEVKTDLAVIRNRNYLDPKRFYKSADNAKGKVLQVGTVIEGSAEFYSARLTKKQRRNNLTEEIMADPVAADYTKNKYKTMQRAKTESHQKFHKKKNSRRERRGY